MSDPQDRMARSIAFPRLVVGISLVLCFAWLGTMMFLVPTFAREFRDAARPLPVVTELTFAASHWTIRYFYVAVAVLLFPGCYAMFSRPYLMRHQFGSGSRNLLWLALLIGVPLVGHLLVWLTLLLPR